MKQLSKKAVVVYAAVSAAAGLLLSVVRSLLSVSALDPGIEMYRMGSGADIMHIVFFCFAVLAFSVYIPARRGVPEVSLHRTEKGILFPTLFTAFMLLAYDIVLILNLVKEQFRSISPLLGKSPTSATGQSVVTLPSAIFLVLMIVAAIPASVYYFKCANAERSSKASLAGFATAPVVWFILFSLHTYFDFTLAFNSPVKIIRIISILSFLFYTIQEARYQVGAPIPALYFATGNLSVLFGLSVSISDAVLYGKGIIFLREGYLVPSFMFFFSLYVLFRLLSVGNAAAVGDTEESADAPAADTDAENDSTEIN